jgi:methyl-accepting chemotaxis protein
MPTPEERLNNLERTVALLEKRLDDADIRSVNHNATMLLGMVLKQQDDIKEIKNTVSNHTGILNNHTAILSEHTLKLNNIEQSIEKLENQTNKNTEALTENTKLLTQMFAMLTKLTNG